MRKLWDWLGNFNNIASILALCGIPVSALTTISAAILGHVEHLRVSYLAILALAVFALSLWSWIGLIWLVENAKSKSITTEKPSLDCAWGLVVDGCFVGFDAPDKPIGCQISVQIRNRLNWPLRYELVSWKVEIDHKTPDIKLPSAVPGILMPEHPHGVNLDGFSYGKIDGSQPISGIIEIVIRYGHPDGDYTRIMSRWFNFNLSLTPQPLFPGLIPTSQTPPPIIGKIPLQTGFFKQDEDVPIYGTKVGRD